MSINIDKAKCIGCGSCVVTCPCDVFRIESPLKKAVAKYEEECQVCSMCTIYCPVDAITIIPEKTTKPITAYR